ncbi:MAG: hypothetical protein JWR11_1916, partial [Mycobacterium sp.]|nr:hypothetical protein [Mycobacterium sp.]
DPINEVVQPLGVLEAAVPGTVPAVAEIDGRLLGLIEVARDQ